MSDFDLVNLPLELKRRVASFLTPKDAIAMSHSCKILYSSVAVSFLRPSRLVFMKSHWNGHTLTGDQPRAFARLPIIDLCLHSVTLTFRWRDQGWGNRKGEIFVIAKRADAPGDPDERFEGGRILCESGIAPHAQETCKMTFYPLEGETYTVWYKVGSGGGHSLTVDAGILHTAIFDDAERNYTKSYFQLHKVGALTHLPPYPGPAHQPAMPVNLNFYLNMLLRVTRSIRRQLSQGVSPDEEVATILHEIDIPMTDRSLLALEEVVHANIDNCEPDRQWTVDPNARPVGEVNVRVGVEPGFFGGMLPEPINHGPPPLNPLMFGREPNIGNAGPPMDLVFFLRDGAPFDPLPGGDRQE